MACASREVVELMAAAVVAGFATDGVDGDCAAAVEGFVGVAAGLRLRGFYRQDCCIAVRLGDLVELVVSQASFAMVVSGWRCRSTVRSVERVGAADGKLVIRANAAHGNASVADAGFRAAAVGEVVAAAAAVVVALRGERFR